GIAGVDAGIGLNERLVGHFLVEADIAAGGADDADGDRVFVAVGVADGNDRLADHEIASRTKRYGGQSVIDVDFQQGEVAFVIAGQDAGAGGGAVGQADADQRDILDDVLVGDDVAALVDEDSGAHAVDAVATVGAGEHLLDAAAPHGAFAVDVHHGL